jgi:hypothetical protein
VFWQVFVFLQGEKDERQRGGILQTRRYTFGFQKMRGVSRIAEAVLTSVKLLCSLELIWHLFCMDANFSLRYNRLNVVENEMQRGKHELRKGRIEKNM